MKFYSFPGVQALFGDSSFAFYNQPEIDRSILETNSIAYIFRAKDFQLIYIFLVSLTFAVYP